MANGSLQKYAESIMISLLSKVPKPIVFAVSAAAGCLLGDLVTEIFSLHSTSGLLQAFFGTIAWSVFLCLGMSAGIVTMQNRLVHKPLIAFPQSCKVVLGAVIGGGIAGAAAQGLYSLSWHLFPEHQMLNSVLVRAIAWGLMGCIVSGAMTLFIANLNKTWALRGGSIGGVLGCIGFLLLTRNFGDIVGRLLGAVLLGLCVGAMVGLVEAAVREAWLNVMYSPKEQTKINLGAKPVSFGTGETDTVFARDTSPHAAVFTLKNGVITCTENRKQRAVANGDRITLGKLTIEVCSQQTGKQASKQMGNKNTVPVPASGASAFCLYVKDNKIPLVEGLKLYGHNTATESVARSMVTGEVIRKKTDPAKLGLRNLSDQAWIFTIPGNGHGTGKKIAYQKGQVFEINNDMQGEIIVDFHGIIGKIAKI
jgi:Ca-activated chloride channel family protein